MLNEEFEKKDRPPERKDVITFLQAIRKEFMD